MDDDDDVLLELRFANGPLHGQVIPWRMIDAAGIWHEGGVYRYSAKAETYTWREIDHRVR